jgi:hypothetical protein
MLHAEMLAHSPHHTLNIRHLTVLRDHEITAEKEISLALQHRNRVGRIPLFVPVPNLQKLIIRAIELRRDSRSSILQCRELLSTLASRDSLIRLLPDPMGFHSSLRWEHRIALASLFLTVILRGNCCRFRSRHTSHFQTFAGCHCHSLRCRRMCECASALDGHCPRD